MTLPIILCQSLKNKNKKLKRFQVQEYKAKENEKTIEDINQKISIITQKFASFERDFNKTLRSLEKEAKEKVDVHVMEQKIEKKINQLSIN